MSGNPPGKLRIALVVPGGVDRSGEYRVIPALLALIRRLATRVELRVFALAQEPLPGRWMLEGASVENIGTRRTWARTLAAIRREHRIASFDLIHGVWAGAVGFAAMSAARWLGVPCAIHVAGGELVDLPQIGYGGRQHLPGRVREWLVLHGAARVTAASEPILEQIRACGVPATRIPLGVDLESWPPAAPRARAPKETARLVHVASLNRVKDQTTLVHALRQVVAAGVDARLDVIGEDTLGGTIQQLVRQSGLAERVHFHGFQTRAAARPRVAAAHVHVVSSLHEAGPLAMLEAAVLGVPTVGTAVGHVQEWSPTAARCTPPGDAGALAQVLRAVIEDDGLRLALAAAAQQRALSEDADFTARSFMDLYAELAATPAATASRRG